LFATENLTNDRPDGRAFPSIKIAPPQKALKQIPAFRH
jgi:hypothetical protein